MSTNRYWATGPLGALVSRSGDEMAATAILLFALVAGAEGGTIVGAMSLMAAIGGPLLGVVLDRSRSNVPFVLYLVCCAAAVALVGVAIGWGAHLLAILLAAVAGLFVPAVSAGWSTILRDPDPERSRRLSVVDAATYSVSALGGPALAGAIYLVAGEVAALGTAVALIAAGAIFAPFAHRRPEPVPDTVLRHPLRDILDGVLEIGRNPRLRSATVATCLAFGGFGMLVVEIPLIGAERLGDAGYGPMLLAVVAGSALAANAVVDRIGALRRPHVVLTVASALMGVGILLFAPDLTPVGAIVAAVVFGLGDGPQLSSIIHIRHRESPAHLRAQIFTTGASLKIASWGLGAILAAALGGLGITGVLVIAAGIHVVAALIAASSWDPRVPTPTPAN